MKSKEKSNSIKIGDLAWGSFVFLLAMSACPAWGTDFSFAGNFHTDDEHRYFSVSTSKSGNITIRTVSYAGGTNAAGSTIPAGGFDPTLALFDSSGALVALNRDGGCGSVSPDPITQFCWDSRLSVSVPPGVYQVVLTQSENTPRGPTVKDPFVYDGSGNFTADPLMAMSDGFWDLSLHHRTGSFAVDIGGVDSALVGLTPSVTALVSAASQLGGQLAPNAILTYYDPGLTGGPVTVTIAGQIATVLYSGVGQINFVVPGTVSPGPSVPVQIARGSTSLISTVLPVTPVSPALFTTNQQGTGQAAVLNADYSANAAATPAARGDYIMVYGTGFGAALPPGPDGLSLLASGVSVTVGGIPADVAYAGLAPGQTPGLQQINVHVPANAPVGPAVGIQLTIAGVSTQAGTTVAVN